jgi:hypothetical protein
MKENSVSQVSQEEKQWLGKVRQSYKNHERIEKYRSGCNENI